MRIGSPHNFPPYFKAASQNYIPERSPVSSKHTPRHFYGFKEPEETTSVYNMVSMQGSNPKLDNLINHQYKGTSFKKLNSLGGMVPTKKPLLTDTEEKIFGEVIGLVTQIDSLKQAIVSQQEFIRKMQIQNPDIDEKVRFHGYCQPLTAQQCHDLDEQNTILMKKIHEIQNKKSIGLSEVLKVEKQKYETSMYQLTESTDPAAASRLNEQKIKELKTMIDQIEQQRKQKIKMHYPGIDRLKNENEQLRQKTITNLKIFKMEQEQEIQLEEYLRREEINRKEFMEELRKFKNDYKKLKTQNENLKEKVQQKSRRANSKQNSSKRANQYTYSQSRKSYESKSRVKTQSALGATRGVESRQNKLNEYESFLKMMQQTLKK